MNNDSVGVAKGLRTVGGHGNESVFLSNVDDIPIEMISVEELLPADSPRLSGEDLEHVRTLAESAAVLPPIIAHRASMRVIDGMHRLHAAAIRGYARVGVRFYVGDAEDAFVLAVRTNVQHGLPLSLADRRQAAARIIGSHPEWSDRAVASVTGLAPKTVSSVRRSAGEVAHSNTRIGRDGHARPMDGAARRGIARKLLAENPEASLRDIARSAGIAPSTVREVRRRMLSGEETVPSPRSPDVTEEVHDSAARPPGVDVSVALQILKSDPSLRFNESGRLLIRLLTGPITGDEWEKIIENIPDHCVTTVVDVARERANAWQVFADRLEARGSRLLTDQSESG